MTFLDLRVLTSPSARGLINSMIGYLRANADIHALVDAAWMSALLADHSIKTERVHVVCRLEHLSIIVGNTVLLPIQRPKCDVAILWLAGVIKVESFVHDLHFLKRSELLRKEFESWGRIPKGIIYKLTIRNANKLLTHSRLVQRECERVFRRKASLVEIARIFRKTDVQLPPVEKDIDVFVPLSGRSYKGIWALPRVIFSDSKPIVVGVDRTYHSNASATLVRNNPHINVIAVSTARDADLVQVYQRSKLVLCLSRHEGFGLIPYEAAAFGAIPAVLNCSAYIEVSRRAFWKLKMEKVIKVPTVDSFCFPPEALQTALRHIDVI